MLDNLRYMRHHLSDPMFLHGSLGDSAWMVCDLVDRCVEFMELSLVNFVEGEKGE